MNNLEISEIVVAKIISQLLENGLEPKTLRESDFGIDKEHLGFVYTSIKWLESEAIIYVEEIHRGTEANVVILVNPALTSKGFNILGQNFLGRPGTETIATAVQTVARENRSYAGIGDFVGGILGGFTKSIGS
jgi:hypothetical protein